MAKLINTVALLAEATGPDLVYTFKALGGKFKEGSAERFASLAAGQRRVEMLLLAAKDADGHLGVEKDAQPVARTQAQLIEKAAKKGRAAPALVETVDAGATPAPEEAVAPALAPAPGVLEFPANSLARKMQVQADAKAQRAAGVHTSKVIAALHPPPKRVKGERTNAFIAFRATNAGTSTFQEGSRRKAMRDYIADAPNQCRTLVEVEKKFDMPSSGEMGKLLMFNHVVGLTEAEYAKLPASLPAPAAPAPKAKGARNA